MHKSRVHEVFFRLVLHSSGAKLVMLTSLATKPATSLMIEVCQRDYSTDYGRVGVAATRRPESRIAVEAVR